MQRIPQRQIEESTVAYLPEAEGVPLPPDPTLAGGGGVTVRPPVPSPFVLPRTPPPVTTSLPATPTKAVCSLLSPANVDVNCWPEAGVACEGGLTDPGVRTSFKPKPTPIMALRSAVAALLVALLDDCTVSATAAVVKKVAAEALLSRPLVASTGPELIAEGDDKKPFNMSCVRPNSIPTQSPPSVSPATLTLGSTPDDLASSLSPTPIPSMPFNIAPAAAAAAEGTSLATAAPGAPVVAVFVEAGTDVQVLVLGSGGGHAVVIVVLRVVVVDDVDDKAGLRSDMPIPNAPFKTCVLVKLTPPLSLVFDGGVAFPAAVVDCDGRRIDTLRCVAGAACNVCCREGAERGRSEG